MARNKATMDGDDEQTTNQMHGETVEVNRVALATLSDFAADWVRLTDDDTATDVEEAVEAARDALDSEE
jgi:hypothetical protein